MKKSTQITLRIEGATMRDLGIDFMARGPIDVQELALKIAQACNGNLTITHYNAVMGMDGTEMIESHAAMISGELSPRQ